MIVNGIDTDSCGDQFGGYKLGRVLITDGDGPAYVAAATVKTLPTAIRKFQQIILTQMYLAEAEHAIVHLTASTSAKAGRYNIIAAKPYQGNRGGKDKPALLEATRQAVAHPDNWLPEYIDCKLHYILEADDGMMIDAHRLGPNGVIRSDDKDLRMTPHLYYCQDQARVIETGGYGSLYMQQKTSTRSCKGYGRKFFWAQMLMGDTADNIQGIATLDGNKCGAVNAFNSLDAVNDENECANKVIAAYRRINQNPIPEGWMLWMLRSETDTFWHYLNELQWEPANRAFLDDCVRREWFKQPEPTDQEEEYA